jgi:hypothetical protein
LQREPVQVRLGDAYHAVVTIRHLGRPAWRLLMTVKSAHVYETERAYVLDVLTGDR